MGDFENIMSDSDSDGDYFDEGEIKKLEINKNLKKESLIKRTAVSAEVSDLKKPEKTLIEKPKEL